MRSPSVPFLLSLALALAPAALAQTPPVACTGLCLQQVQCTGSATTTISGTVYAPNGLDPLPNVLVYIPNAPVDAFTAGVSCPVVGTPPPGSPLVGTTTAVNGSFTITNVPVGTGIPLVIQTGRWRRQFLIDINNSCADNPTVGIRMPRNHTEGDIPKIAVATGSADSVECVLRKVGIDDTEFTDITGKGRINLFPGSGSPGTSPTPSTANETTLMENSTVLNQYDVLMLPCEGGIHTDVKDATQYANLVAFANAGGRVYASHFSYQWMINNSPFDTVANWGGNGAPVGGTATNLLSSSVVTNFSEGNILAQWLQLVGASTTPGKIGLQYVKKDINSINPPTQPYLTLDSNGAVMQFVWDTPVKATTNQCGRVLFNEYHVENPTIASPGTTFPAECSPDAMTAQEKLLEFSLFELTADGSAATLTPPTADFGTEPINFTTAARQFTWTNNSTFGSSVTLLTTTGDFAVAGSNCSAVPAGGSCTINVVFKPTATGARTGTLTVGSTGSTLLSSLTGSGIPDLVFNFTSFDFGPLDVGATSSKSIVVTNNASGPVTVPGLVTTGDYTATNSCGSQVAALGTCTITVSFKPTTNGTRAGTLSVNSSDPAYTGNSTTLTGVGLDFTIATTPSTGTVIAGYTNTTQDVVTPLSGLNVPLTLTCAVSAPGSTCSVSNVNFGGSTAAVINNVTITTTAQYTVVGYGGFGTTGWLWIVGLGSGAFLLLGRRRIGGTLRAGLMLILIATAGLSLTGCSGKLPAQNKGYTAPGLYTYTITATDGFLVHSTTYTLNVTTK